MSNDPHDLLAAYALDALDDDERERFERHLADCAECSEQLALLREPVAALAYAAEGPAPPEALRGRIIESAPASKTYEAWVIAGKTPQPAGLFRGGSGCSPLVLTQRVPKGATVAAT